MSNKEILEKAISKAIDGGWDILARAEADGFMVREDSYGNLYVAWNPDVDDFEEGDEVGVWAQSWQEVVFDHSFAEALWSGEKTMRDPTGTHFASGWQYHLQHMVVAEDPIKYLGENP